MNEFDTPTVDVNIEEFYANNSTENLNFTSPDTYSYFNDLYYIDVGDHIEKKNDLSYLSWPYAVAEISKKFPDFQYKILTFGKDNLPYMLDEKTGYMVWTEVTIQGITRKMWLPVMDGANKSMKDKPYTYKTKYGEKTVEAATMFDINKTIMRCLVKNFAMFGLGLYIYAGEDLPEESDEERARKEEAKKEWTVDEIKSLIDTNDIFVIRSLIKLYSYQTDEEQAGDMTSEHNGFGFNSFDAKALSGMTKILTNNFIISKSQVNYARTKLKKYAKQLTRIANGAI